MNKIDHKVLLLKKGLLVLLTVLYVYVVFLLLVSVADAIAIEFIIRVYVRLGMGKEQELLRSYSSLRLVSLLLLFGNIDDAAKAYR